MNNGEISTVSQNFLNRGRIEARIFQYNCTTTQFDRYEIKAHNPYTKSFQYWHSVFERKLLSLRGLVSINNRRHSVSILLINDYYPLSVCLYAAWSG